MDFLPSTRLSRRTLLHAASCVATTAAGSEFLSGWMQAATVHQHSPGTKSDAPNLDNYRPQFFSQSDYESLQAFTEILIPTDGTPGAREAHCAAFIDFVLAALGDTSPETQQQWRDAMSALRQSGFHNADSNQRLALVAQITKPERDQRATHIAFSAYKLIKRENTFAFYTAYAGSIQALNYRGNTYNIQFPACNHPEHQRV